MTSHGPLRVAPAVLSALAALFALEARPAQPAATALPPAGTPPDARSVLSSVRRAYSSSVSVSCSFVQTYAPAGFPEASPEKGRLTLQAPDKIRFDYDGVEGKVFTFDGKAARQYVAADRQMIVKTLSAADRARLPLLFFASPDTTLSGYTASVRASGEDTAVTLVPVAGGDPRSLELTAAPDGTVRRLAVVDAAGNTTRFTFTERRAGGPLPAATFALSPPAGTKVVSD